MFQFQQNPNKAPVKKNDDDKSNQSSINFSLKMLEAQHQALRGNSGLGEDKGAPIQKQAGQEEEGPLQAKVIPTQMMVKEEEEKSVQAKAKNLNTQTLSQTVSTGTTTKMPEGVQAKMENSFGASFGNVNVHQNDNSATEMGALAYTQGNDVHFAPGQYNPNTQAGQELLGHELTHVVQQRAGRVKETKQCKGFTVNDDQALENEADAMGKRAAEGKAVDIINSNEVGGVQMKRELPSGIERMEIESGKVIDEFEKLWQKRPKEYRNWALFDTPDSFKEHPDLPSLIRGVCGGRYFHGTNYWNSGWMDDGDTDILWAGDADVKAEILVFIDNETPHSNGSVTNNSSGEYNTSDQRSRSTTYDGKGTIGAEKGGVEASLEAGVSHTEGRTNTDSTKGGLSTSSNLNAKFIKGDVVMEISLSFKPSIWDPVIGVKTVSETTGDVGDVLISSVF